MPRRASTHGLSKSTALQWSPVKGERRTYELKTPGKILARMRWPHVFGSLAEATIENERWTFKRSGFLRPRVTVRRPPMEVDCAVMELHWNGNGLFQGPEQQQFRWQRMGFWTRHFAFTELDGQRLVTFEPSFGVMKRTCEVEATSGVERLPAFGLLVSLGWYVIMLIADDDAAGAAVMCGG